MTRYLVTVDHVEKDGGLCLIASCYVMANTKREAVAAVRRILAEAKLTAYRRPL